MAKYSDSQMMPNTLLINCFFFFVLSFPFERGKFEGRKKTATKTASKTVKFKWNCQKSLEFFFFKSFSTYERGMKCAADNNIILKSIMFSLIACEFNKNCLENSTKETISRAKETNSMGKKHEQNKKKINIYIYHINKTTAARCD